jgi:hypothetical protein
MTEDPKPDKASDFFDEYKDFAKVLQTWFVAYGIGGPVLLLTNDTLRCKIFASGHACCIGAAFLTSVALQVILGFLNKNALWFCYRAAREPRLKRQRVYRVAHRWAYEFCIEFTLDCISLILLFGATGWVFIILINT